MNFRGNFLCCSTCHSCIGKVVGEIIHLEGIFLLEVLFMPFFLGEEYISFGETLFSFKNLSSFSSCLSHVEFFLDEWFGCPHFLFL